MPLTDQEQQLHRTRVGASLVPAIIGVNPFQGPMDAWLQLTGRAERVLTSEAEARTQWGHVMEELLASWYSEQVGRDVAPSPTLIHPELSWAIATPDRVDSEGACLVECKHVGHRVAWHWTDGPPDYVRAQCAWQMLVCRALGMPVDRVVVVADVGGAPPAMYEVHHDQALEDELVAVVSEFWTNHVLVDVPPPVDSSASYSTWLRRQFPGCTGVMRESQEAEQWARMYVGAKERIETATEEANLAANHLRALIAGDDGVRGAWGHATNRANRSGNKTLRVVLTNGSGDRRRKA